jgi:glycosyltransferase involved in cell wall biosynthesis
MEKKTKILFAVAKMGIGGAERSVLDQINNLDRKLFDPYLCTLLTEQKESFMSSVNISEEKKIFFDFNSYFNLKSWISLIKYLKKENLDIIFCNLFKANTILRVAAIFAGTKKVFIAEQNIYPGKQLSKFIVDKILSIVTTKIIAISYAVKEFLIKEGHISPHKIVILYHGIDFKQFDELENKRDILRSKFSFSKNEVIILSAGRISKQKGYDVLLDTAYQLKKELDLKFRFLIAGNKKTDLGKELERKAEKMGVSDIVSFLDVRRDIPELLIASDIFFLPSRWEGFCIALVEAMAAGLPFVAGEVGFISAEDRKVNGTKNMIHGLIIENYGSDEFAKNLSALISDESLRKKMGDAAREKSKYFSIDNNIKQLQNIFKSY